MKNYLQLKTEIDDIKHYDKFENYIKNLLGSHNETSESYRKAIKNIGYMATKKWPSKKVEISDFLIEYANVNTASQLIIESSSTSKKIQRIASFREQITSRSIKRNLLPDSCCEWLLDNKLNSYKFIDLLGIRRPYIIKKNIKLSEIEPRFPCVIKPESGYSSNGVYLLFSKNEILNLKTKEKIDSFDELIISMRNDIEKKLVPQDNWIIEELIGDKKTPVIDVKLYCFYGKIEIILEILRYPETSIRFTNASGERLRTGVNIYPDTFSGETYNPEILNLAKKISENIPAPFISIDFITAGDFFCFGEFTPRPGIYTDYNSKIDNQLGIAFIEAEARLFKDMTDRKRFHAFEEYALLL